MFPRQWSSSPRPHCSQGQSSRRISAEGETTTPSQNWIPVSRLTTHMHQEGMKILITHIMRLSGQAWQAFNLIHLDSVKGQMALGFIVVASSSGRVFSSSEFRAFLPSSKARFAWLELPHWCQGKEHLDFLTSLS